MYALTLGAWRLVSARTPSIRAGSRSAGSAAHDSSHTRCVRPSGSCSASAAVVPPQRRLCTGILFSTDAGGCGDSGRVRSDDPRVVAFKSSPIELYLVRERTLALPLHRDRSLRRVSFGVYAPRSEWEALKPWDRYLARVHAVRLIRPDAVFCFESAGALRGFPLFGEPKLVHIVSSPATTGHGHSFGGVAVHRLAPSRATETLAEVSAVSAADTLIDLARLLPPAYGLAVADAAMRTAAPGVTASALLERAFAQGWPRGIRRLKWILNFMDASAESPGESVSRAVIHWLGYPAPVLQKWFLAEGCRDRVDFYWPEADIIGESDGYGKYDADDPEKAKAHFIAEKVREDRLRRQVRGFARWDLADALNVTALDEKLRASGLTPVRRPDLQMLATVGRNPRSFAPAGA